MKGKGNMKKFVVRNKRTNTTFHVEQTDERPVARRMRRPAPVQAETHDSDAPELTKKEIETLKEFIKFIPDIKKLLEPEDKPEDEEDEGEDEGGTDDEGIAGPEEGDGEDVILEEEQEEELIDEEEEEEGEETQAEDGCGSRAHDSRASFGSMVARSVGDNVLVKEEEVAKAFDSRYTKSLRK